MNLWNTKLRQLEFEIDRVSFHGLELEVPSGWKRRSTILRLHSGALVGEGEDVNYSGDEQLLFQSSRAPDLAGKWSLEQFSERLDGLNLFEAGPPEQAAYRDYRRWAYESAALDLALKTCGKSLSEALERESRDVRFVASLSLGSPLSLEGLERRLAVTPGLRFKVDASPDWDDGFCAKLERRNLVDVVDLKGFYEGTVVDMKPDPALYERVVRNFRAAWIEDARWTEETGPVLAPHADRLTLDAPLHSVTDLEGLPFAPRCMNCKPSRFGTLAKLFEFYATCQERDIALYAGGQFELGVGRGQNLRLASIFHADASNDIAPLSHHHDPPRVGSPSSPLRAKGDSNASHFANW